MGRDISRLFSMIKQADLPYQEFDEAPAEAKAAAPAADPAPPVADKPLHDNEDAGPAHSGLFKAYNVEAELAAPPPGVQLSDMFRRMARARD
jgi:hypothetical protein